MEKISDSMKKILLAGIEEKDPADVLKGMSPEQIAALKEAIAQKEAADAAQDDEEEAPDEA